MTYSEDFKQALKTGKLSEAFLLAMSNAPELHITTWIASPESNETSPQAGNRLRTHINLVEGKIENEIGENFIGDRNPEIQQFHLQQVNQGHQTIQQNLESLQKMFYLMTAFQERQSNNSALAWVDIPADSLSPEERRLNSKDAIGSLAAAEENSESATASKPEPQLSAFTPEEDEALVDELLTLSDLDDIEDDEEDANAAEDWGDWLEDEETSQLPKNNSDN